MMVGYSSVSGLKQKLKRCFIAPVLRRIIDHFNGVAADTFSVERDRAVAVLFDGSAFARRRLIQRFARFHTQAEVWRMLRAGREQRDAEAARIAQHRPIVIESLKAKPDALILLNVTLQILR